MTPTSIDEARRMFSRPDADERDDAPDDRVEMENKIATAKATAKSGSTGDWTREERMAMKIAAKARKKYAILNQGDDAIILFGRHKEKKVSVLAATPDGRDYLRWMLGAGFDDQILKVVSRWLGRI